MMRLQRFLLQGRVALREFLSEKHMKMDKVGYIMRDDIRGERKDVRGKCRRIAED